MKSFETIISATEKANFWKMPIFGALKERGNPDFITLRSTDEEAISWTMHSVRMAGLAGAVKVGTRSVLTIPTDAFDSSAAPMRWEKLVVKSAS